ncbi:MAG TPA: hypothetical protein VFG73_04275 [Rhodanobacteraceae bacterium]|nr:hypothetical protein [Rhodanobacteraceae bacterium]
MSAAAARLPRHDPRRLRRLAALGLKPWRLRGRDDASGGAAAPRCLVLAPAAALADARQRRLVEALAAALSLPANALRLVAATPAALATAPAAPAWVALGEDAAALAAPRAQGQALARLDSPAALLASAAAKRSAWQALKALRRALREA